VTVDLLFPAVGDDLPTDHAYPMYGALSGLVPGFHQPGGPRFLPLSGESGGPGRLRLTPRSRLRVRADADHIRAVLPLAGRRLDVAGSGVRLGAPEVHPLVPAPALAARVATVKLAAGGPPEADGCVASWRKSLEALGIAGRVGIPTHRGGRWEGRPVRRVVRVKGKAIVGYAAVVTGLSAADSVRLQEVGLGGRTRLGCGFLLPATGAN
jgi:CRISPR-associated protein Cas6